MPPIDPSFARKLKSAMRGFFRREDGAITIESMLILPMVFWSVFTSYTYFDGYRQSSLNTKAAYAVADVLSRERNAVNDAYVNTLHDLMETMVSTRAPVSMRVSYLIFEADDGEDAEPGDGTHDIVWSCVRGAAFQQMSEADEDYIKNALPTMPDNGRMIVVETHNTYRAPFNIGFGFDDFVMGNLVFTHPRVYDNIHGPAACY